MQRLLVSVRGPNEAIAAAKGGAHIADVEYPGSALGTPYPLNIKAVRDSLDEAGYKDMPISTNIGEDQYDRASACQAALGVAVAGADFVKCGLANLELKAAKYLGRNLTRTVREWCPEAKVYPAVFPEEEYARLFDPLVDGPALVESVGCDGLLIDTYNKNVGKGLMDYYSIEQLQKFVDDFHSISAEAWLAGSVSLDELPDLWATGVDVICVRGAACKQGSGDQRFGQVCRDIVSNLICTIPGEQ
jgi:(5-formylfuran-3-yl)methyl phosphate synthase